MLRVVRGMRLQQTGSTCGHVIQSCWMPPVAPGVYTTLGVAISAALTEQFLNISGWQQLLLGCCAASVGGFLSGDSQQVHDTVRSLCTSALENFPAAASSQ